MIIRRKPEWLRKRVSITDHAEMDKMLASLSLNTVCREASCPNISECYGRKQATFLIMGRECTRGCTFCNVSSSPPSPLDPDEPSRVAEAVKKLALRHVVITSPTRDDLEDGGAEQFARTVAAIRRLMPKTTVELLIPDFKGDYNALQVVIDAAPDILAHNIETVPRLYHIRAGADYSRSLQLLERVSAVSPTIPTKSGIMVGLGETTDEVVTTIGEIRKSGCSYLSIGQYLSPSRLHQPVADYIEPAQFDEYRKIALELGFSHVESAPYVRSSYHAERYAEEQN